MTDAAVVGRLLGEYHERRVDPAAVTVLAGSEHQARVSYLVRMPDGARQILRAFRADAPISQCGVPVQPVADWLLGRARTVQCLAAAGYRAPRPVRTRTGELIGTEGAWLSWATTQVPGDPLEPSLTPVERLGAVLGWLHTVPAASGPDGDPGRAPCHPALAASAALRRLGAVADRLPRALRPMAQACRDSILAVQAAATDVPETLVHGDASARSAVQATGSDEVTLVGWERGGRGLAVIDLGHCLLECQAARPAAAASPVEPEPVRIAAIARGYASRRHLSGAERSLLPAATMFTAAVAAAAHFEVALIDGVGGPVMEQRLAALRTRIEASGEVAALALREFAR